jgi:SpoVK/Ycf46/Vps4 family AAA+-type ATPase
MTYSYPGVYIEELPGGVHPIPGLLCPVPVSRLLFSQNSRVWREIALRAKKIDFGTCLLLTGCNKKTRLVAAGALARKLHLKLYRIDLAALVNNYIGETEKSLRRLFDAAGANGAVLLFDEADALFGKRPEVKDGHDRYANLETVCFERSEVFRGLAIMSTNRRENIDRGSLAEPTPHPI